MEKFKGIEIPTTAADWDLYSDAPGADDAAIVLTYALKASCLMFVEMLGSMSDNDNVAKVLARAANAPNGIHQRMKKYAKLGAYDSEPRYHAHQALIDFAKKRLFGDTGKYMPELGDWL